MYRLLCCSATKLNIFKQNIPKYPSFKHLICGSLYPASTRFIHTSTIFNFAAAQQPTITANVAKDIIIFKYENPKFFRYMNIFAYCQFLFWSYLSYFAYTDLRDVPVNQLSQETNSWWQNINLGDRKYRTGIAICCFAIGYGILAMAWMYTLRSIRFLVLRKGSAQVSLVTYTPFGRNRIIDVPLHCLSAQDSRQTAKVLLPLKVKGSRLYHIMDMRGTFLNKDLYDRTIGIKRRFDL